MILVRFTWHMQFHENLGLLFHLEWITRYGGNKRAPNRWNMFELFISLLRGRQTIHMIPLKNGLILFWNVFYSLILILTLLFFAFLPVNILDTNSIIFCFLDTNSIITHFVSLDFYLILLWACCNSNIFCFDM